MAERSAWSYWYVALGGAVVGVAVGPFVGCGFIAAIPSLASAKFISEGDGSVGPAFWMCLAVWAGFAVMASASGVALAVWMGRQRARA